jgi:hypothetical protein
MKYTDEQKEHIKAAEHASMRIDETWQLYQMYLQIGDSPLQALEKARAAVMVWAEWMDSEKVDFPDIEQPDVVEQITAGMTKVYETVSGLQQKPNVNPFPFVNPFPVQFPGGGEAEKPDEPSQVDAEFVDPRPLNK